MHHMQVLELFIYLHLQDSKCQKIPNCYEPDAFLKLKCTKLVFGQDNAPYTPWSAGDGDRPDRIPSLFPSPSTPLLAPCEHPEK